MELLVGVTALGAVSQIAQSADRVLRRNPGYLAEVSDWTRTDSTDDGVPVGAAGPAGESHDLFPARPYGGRTRALGRDFEPEPLIAVLGSAGNTADDQINSGAGLQSVLLTAVDAGLATSMISQPIEVATAREQLRRALGRSGTPQMVLRIGYGNRGRPTPRRGLAYVID